MAKESAGPSSLAVRTAGFAPDERPEGLCIYDWDVVPRQEDVTALDRPDNIILTARPVPAPLLSFTQALVLLKPLNRARLELALRSAEPAGSTADQAAQLSRLVRFHLHLQDIEQNWSNFFGRAVRELRAPLTSLSGYTDLLLERRLGPLSEQQETVIGRMRRSTSRLSAMVSAMQLFTQGLSDAEIPPIKESDYAECIEQAVRHLTPLIMQRRVEVMLDLVPCGGTIRADTRQMEEVFVNLLDNSCKYGPRGGVVRVAGYPWSPSANHAVAEPGEPERGYRVDISDSGPSIEPELLHQIFEGAPAELENERAGADLSLAMCNLIVKRHNGALWAESSPERTTFSLVLPMN
ncbi:MAG: HAMP domain-containing histidine kinase [Bryobacterales bacterium]|nr:HAMP domain-containing histidine kinase [Bryobacterales bacterium]